jgi:hypothetical protein
MPSISRSPQAHPHPALFFRRLNHQKNFFCCCLHNSFFKSIFWFVLFSLCFSYSFQALAASMDTFLSYLVDITDIVVDLTAQTPSYATIISKFMHMITNQLQTGDFSSLTSTCLKQFDIAVKVISWGLRTLTKQRIVSANALVQQYERYLADAADSRCRTYAQFVREAHEKLEQIQTKFSALKKRIERERESCGGQLPGKTALGFFSPLKKIQRELLEWKQNFEEKVQKNVEKMIRDRRSMLESLEKAKDQLTAAQRRQLGWSMGLSFLSTVAFVGAVFAGGAVVAGVRSIGALDVVRAVGIGIEARRASVESKMQAEQTGGVLQQLEVAASGTAELNGDLINLYQKCRRMHLELQQAVDAQLKLLEEETRS